MWFDPLRERGIPILPDILTNAGGGTVSYFQWVPDLRRIFLTRDEIRATVWTAAGEEGFRENRTGDPPSEDDVNWAIQDTGNLCRALGLLTVGADWRDRSCGLTETGKAAASEALRARAPGPRTIPWP